MIDDYAYPAMMAEKALKELHFGIIDNEREKAKEAARELLDRSIELYLWVNVWDAQKQG